MEIMWVRLHYTLLLGKGDIDVTEYYDQSRS